MLSRTLPPMKTGQPKGRFGSLLEKTRNLLNGKPEEANPNEISKLMWSLIIEAWPEYNEIRPDGKCIQHDAPELLLKLIAKLVEEDSNVTNCLQTKINSTKRCTNLGCETLITSRKEEENILRNVEIPNNTKINLQTIIDNFIPQLTTNMDDKCLKCGKECEETNTLMVPPPMIIIHINKAKLNLEKTEIEIKVDDVIKVTTTENPDGELYTVTDVISHLGSTASNGHYITTHYHEEKKTWESINDHKCSEISITDAADINKHGVVYVMKRQKNDLYSSENYFEQGEPKYYHNLHPEINNSYENGTNSRNQQNSSKNLTEGDGYSLVEARHKKRKQRSNPWKMVPNENPWSRINSRGELEKNNKRYYTDRDEPSENKEICWWHSRNRCNFGKNCWYSHSKQPFWNGAQ